MGVDTEKSMGGHLRRFLPIQWFLAADDAAGQETGGEDIDPSPGGTAMFRTITGEQRRRETKGEQRMVDWKGVFPAVTTQFRADQSLDVEATMAHVERLISSGCHGLIMLGTVGENVQLEAQEKRAVISASIKAAAGRVPVLSGVAETSTTLACRYATDCRSLGVDGLMVLPAMVYKSDPRETIAHYRAVTRAGELPVMIYNNPVSYGVDITPPMLAELADEPMLVALKE